jgi:hypothetical protein
MPEVRTQKGHFRAGPCARDRIEEELKIFKNSGAFATTP